MPTYDITSHPLLSEKAQDLETNSPDVFSGNVDVAEAIHNLAGTTYTGSQLTQAKLVLVYQVNLQVEKDEYSELYKRVKEGDRDYQLNNAVVSEMAKQLREQLYNDDKTEAEEKTKRGASRSRRNYPIW